MKNKIFLKKLLLTSSLLIISALPLGAIACGVRSQNPAGPTNNPTDSNPKTLIDEELKKVTVDVKNKSDVEAVKVSKEMVVFSNYDSNKYNVELKEIIPNNQKQLLLVKFNLKEKEGETISEERVIEVKEFKKFVYTAEILNQEIEKVKYDYNGKDQVTSWKADENNIIFTDYDADLFEIIKEQVKPANENLSLQFTFYLKDKTSDVKSGAKTGLINGFKAMNPEKSSVSELFWGDTKGILNVPNDKRDDLYEALNKKALIYLINITNRKFVVSTGKEEVDFEKPSTFKEVGTIDEEFAKKQISAFDKLMENVFGSFVFNKFKTFLSSTKEEQTKTLEEIKIVLQVTSSLLKNQITFDKDFVKTLEEIISRDVQKIVFNFKTGELVTNAKDGEAVDLHNSSTYKVIAELQEDFLKKVNQEILNQLTSSNISTNAYDKFFQSENTPFFYLKKSGQEITSVVGIDHLRT